MARSAQRQWERTGDLVPRGVRSPRVSFPGPEPDGNQAVPAVADDATEPTYRFPINSDVSIPPFPDLGCPDPALRPVRHWKSQRSWRSALASTSLHAGLLLMLMVGLQPTAGALRGGEQAIEVEVMVLGAVETQAAEPGPGEAPAESADANAKTDLAGTVPPVEPVDVVPEAEATPPAATVEAKIEQLPDMPPVEPTAAPTIVQVIEALPAEPAGAVSALNPTALPQATGRDSVEPDQTWSPAEPPKFASLPEAQQTLTPLTAEAPPDRLAAVRQPPPEAPAALSPARRQIPSARRPSNTEKASREGRNGREEGTTKSVASQRGGTTGAATEAGAADIATYRARVLGHLARHKLYPGSARDRGIEGRATLAFSIARDGTIVTASLAESSSASVLDEATMAMLRRAAPFPPIPNGGPPTMSFRTAVSYFLKGN